MENKKTEIVICKCGSDDHQIIIHHDVEDKQVYLHLYLAKRPFFYRVLAGFKYIFGYHCRYGHWDEIILGPEHADQFQNLVDTLKNRDKVV